MRELRITPNITKRDTESVTYYFQEVSRIGLMQPEEEAELGRRIKEGDQAAIDRLVKANLRFVISVAKKYQNCGLTLNDLINEGNLGLIKAATRFDESRGFKFISFAVWWIRQSMMAAIQDQARIIRVPANHSLQMSRLLQLRASFHHQHGREPLIDEIAEEMDMDPDQVSQLLIRDQRVDSLDTPVFGEDDVFPLERYDFGTEQPDAAFEHQNMIEHIRQHLSHLTQREKQIIELAYGLNGGSPMITEDIACVVGVGKERVRQLKHRALATLRFRMTGKNYASRNI